MLEDMLKSNTFKKAKQVSDFDYIIPLLAPMIVCVVHNRSMITCDIYCQWRCLESNQW